MMIKTKNQMTLIAKIYREVSESEHSCHDPSHTMSKLSSKNFGHFAVPKVVTMYCQTVVYFEGDFDNSS